MVSVRMEPMIPHKAFVVADIPEPHKSALQHIRDQLKTVTAKLPVEITLAGSSGVGPIPEGTDLDLIRDEVVRIARVKTAFSAEFGGISHFPDTGIFFIPPADRKPFDSLHTALASSKIPFGPSPFPYNPHCTLRVGPKVEPREAEQIQALAVPRGPMLIDSLSVYAVDGRTLAVSLLVRAKLRE
jgi:2'-5' RNA ligase